MIKAREITIEELAEINSILENEDGIEIDDEDCVCVFDRHEGRLIVVISGFDPRMIVTLTDNKDKKLQIYMDTGNLPMNILKGI